MSAQRSADLPVPRDCWLVIDCRARLKERLWDRRRQRRICAALEQRYLAAGWQYASVYVMEHDNLRLRVTLRAHPSRRAAVR